MDAMNHCLVDICVLVEIVPWALCTFQRPKNTCLILAVPMIMLDKISLTL